jgi:hypothetical protein
MAPATKSRSASSPKVIAVSSTVARAKEAGDTLNAAARTAKRPVLAAGAAAAGLAGGIALGSRMSTSRRGLSALVRPQRTILGVPLGRRNGLRRMVDTLGKAAHELGALTNQVSSTTDEIRQVREQLDKANRQSPLEVVLDALTHRRGAHKHES